MSREPLDRLADVLRDRLLADAEAGTAAPVDRIAALVEREGALLDPATREELLRRVSERALGLGPLQPLLEDPAVDEVMVSGPESVWVERAGRIEATDVRFESEAELRDVIERVLAPLGRRVDEAWPLVDARLPDGSRVNVVIPPLAVDGPALTIRRFRHRSLTAADLVAGGTLGAPLLDFLASAVRARCTVLVCGGTGSGKTTTLNALSEFIGQEERVVTIEDAAELRLRQPHVVRLEARPPGLDGSGEVPIRALVRNALRMRPDRIIVGEVRGPEALDMLGALSCGHDGSLCTVHAGSAAEALRRLETLALMAGVGLPHAAIREQVADAVDLVVCQARRPDGTRVVVEVAEVVRVAAGAGVRALHAARRPPDVARRAVRPAGWAPDGGTGGGVSRAVLLALGAGVAGVGGGWELLASLQRDRAAAWLEAALRPLRRTAAAGTTPTDEERRRLALLVAACLLAGGWIVAGPLVGGLAAVAGPAAAAGCVRTARRRYHGAVAAGAAEAARALAASLAAGRSIRAAVADASGGLTGPVAHEFARTAAELAAGEPTDGALEALRQRAASRAWDALVAAILLQRDAGGDLATLLRDLAGTLDQARRAERDGRAATSQARFTAWTVAGLPVAAAALAELADPGFVGGLLGRPLSAVLVAAAALLEATALAAIHMINRGVERAA